VDWLLEEDCRLVAAALALVPTGVVWSPVAAEVIAVGAGSSVVTAFGSGLSSGAVIAPLALFAALIFRAATVASRTVSVDPFIPPSER